MDEEQRTQTKNKMKSQFKIERKEEEKTIFKIEKLNK